MLSRSYTQGTANHPMWYITIPDLLDQRAKEYPDKDMYVFWTTQSEGTLTRESISYQDLAERSTSVAASLLNMGLEPDDRLLIVADNCLEWTVVEYAVMRCKLLLVRIPPENISVERIAQLIVEYSCRAIIVDGGTHDRVTRLVKRNFLRTEDPGVNKKNTVQGMRIIALKGASGSKQLTVSEMAVEVPRSRMQDMEAIQSSIKPDDVAVVLTSSGTHGLPQLIKLSHFAIINNTRCVHVDVLSDSGARYFNDSPFYWVGSNMYASVCFGITMVQLDKKSQNDFLHVSAVLSAERVTVGKFMASFLSEVYHLSRRGRTTFPETMQYIITGGTALHEDATLFFQSQCRSILKDYGTTETLSVATHLTTHQHTDPYYIPLPNVEIKIVSDKGSTLSINELGCLWVKSPYLFRGYLEKYGCDDDVIHSDELHGGWYNTWDVARMNDNGGFEILGRHFQAIKKGSHVIFPAEIEEKIEAMPCVNDVCVVGILTTGSDQDICACIIPVDGCDEKYMCRALDNFRTKWNLDYPIKYILLLHDFPTVPNGTVNRKQLVKIAISHFDK